MAFGNKCCCLYPSTCIPYFALQYIRRSDPLLLNLLVQVAECRKKRPDIAGNAVNNALAQDRSLSHCLAHAGAPGFVGAFIFSSVPDNEFERLADAIIQ